MALCLRSVVLSTRKMAQQARPSSDLAAFKAAFAKAKSVAVITGAGISAESGIPTFRGAGGFWRQWQATSLATPEAFSRDPSLVWEFYHYRRDLVLSKEPNAGHYALSSAQKQLEQQGRQLSVITQNIDELHKKAGTKDLIELHGSLFKLRCIGCQKVEQNYENPLTPALAGTGMPDPDAKSANLKPEDLPKCKDCGSLLRPHVVWFGEPLDPEVLAKAEQVLDGCDLCLVVGTSSVVYPAAMFAPQVASRGVPVAEFNIEETPATTSFGFHFSGPSSQTLPSALST